MEKNQTLIGIDSNALTYLIDAINPLYDPEKDHSGLAAEKVAMLRIFFYRGEPYYVLPTVKEEYKKIKDSDKRKMHESVHEILMFDYLWEIDNDMFSKLTKKYYNYHRNANDCAVVAEAEIGGLHVLLTCDDDLIHRLSPQTNKLKLMRPFDYWRELNIRPGTRPTVAPHSTNPLSDKTWWLIL